MAPAKNVEAVRLFQRFRDEGVPTVITGREAALLSEKETGRIVAGLVRHADSNSHPVPLAKVARAIVKGMN